MPIRKAQSWMAPFKQATVKLENNLSAGKDGLPHVLPVFLQLVVAQAELEFLAGYLALNIQIPLCVMYYIQTAFIHVSELIPQSIVIFFPVDSDCVSVSPEPSTFLP